MKILLLNGLNSDARIWDNLLPALVKYEVEVVAYPHEVTKQAHCPSDLSAWVASAYASDAFDIIIGHSLGGIIALELISKFQFDASKVIIIESNLKPANPFYRNLLTPKHEKAYGSSICSYLKEQSQYFSEDLMKSVQEDFDYSSYVLNSSSAVYGIYGDRAQKEYSARIQDLCLEEDVLNKIQFSFIENACHLPMIENPEDLNRVILEIVAEK